MPNRQQVLHLWTVEAALDTTVIAWAFYDGTGGEGPALPTDEPPYATAVDALLDGWFLLQTAPPAAPTGEATGEFRYEAVFERRVAV